VAVLVVRILVVQRVQQVLVVVEMAQIVLLVEMAQPTQVAVVVVEVIYKMAVMAVQVL
jgi:hypothetical protein